MSLVYLDQAPNGDLIIMQDDQRIVMNPTQVNEVIDILLGPSKIKTAKVDISELLSPKPTSDAEPN